MRRKTPSPLIRNTHSDVTAEIAAPILSPPPPRPEPKPVKTRQAEYVARRREDGFRRVSFFVHELSFGEGYNIGLAGKNTPASNTADPFSFLLGWTDGLLARHHRKPGPLASRLLPVMKDADLKGT